MRFLGIEFNFRDGVKQELNAPVKFRYVIRAFLIALALGFLIALVVTGKNTMEELTERQRVEAYAVAEFDLRRQFVKTEAEQVYGTVWDACGFTVGARHVDEETKGALPPRSLGPRLPTLPDVDAIFYGRGSWPCEFTRDPVDGERVWIMGYPASSDAIATRRATVYLKRSATDTYITLFDPYSIADFFGEPVGGGMSGGVVLSEELEPIGILITQNSQFDSDEDGESENGADVVGLRTAVRALIGAGL